MGQFHHDHVIKLYGVVTRVDPAMIVMEFMDNGSLYSHLRVQSLNKYYLVSTSNSYIISYREEVLGLDLSCMYCNLEKK